MKMLVKEAYEENPPIRYPMITIEEIRNSENERFSDNLGEHYSNIGYQIDCHTRNLSQLKATEAVRLMGTMVNDLFLNTYKMVRVGEPVLRPLPNDKTILVYTLRFEGVLGLDDNRIYKN